MTNTINLQEKFLNISRENNINLTVFLINGYQIKGSVIGFDNYTIILKSDEKHQLIYKHAISTIIPNENIELKF